MLLGVIEEPAAVDAHGWAAWLRVERSLGPGPDAAGGERVRIAWEELAPGRPARFAAGDRVLVALEPLPGWSLWRQRFPHDDALAVAEAGQAFLRDPDGATIEGLARWLALSGEARDGRAGAAALAELIANACAPIARAAVARLAEVPGLGSRLDPPALADLARAITDPGRPSDVRSALVELAGQRRITRLRPAIETTARAGRPPALAATAWTALAALDGGLPEPTLAMLLDARAPELRAAAVPLAVGTPLEPRLASLAVHDPAPAVRAAAVAALVATRRPDAVDLGLRALFDPASAVRAQAARSLGELGAEVVPRLRALADAHSGREAAGPLAALALSGPAGQAALREIGLHHPDPQTRRLARLFAGQDIHEH